MHDLSPKVNRATVDLMERANSLHERQQWPQFDKVLVNNTHHHVFRKAVSSSGLDLFARLLDNAAWLQTVITTEAMLSQVDLQTGYDNGNRHMTTDNNYIPFQGA